MKKLIFIFCITILAVNTLKSQDKIYLRHDTINARIIENGIKSYKYQIGNSLIEEIKKKHVLRVEFANDSVVDFGSTNLRKLKPRNIGIACFLFVEQGIETEFQYNGFVNSTVAINGTIGFDMEGEPVFSFGPRFYINRLAVKSRVAPYIGVQAGIGSNYGPFISIPYGIDVVFKCGLNLALEMNYRLSSFYGPVPGLGIKAGFAF